MSRVARDTRVDGEIKVHTIYWTIPELMNHITNDLDKLCTQSSMDPGAEIGKRFQMQMQFWAEANQDVIHVEFKSPIRIFILEYNLFIAKKLNIYDSKPVASMSHVLLHANEWENIITLTEELRNMYIVDYGTLSMKFEFKLINTIKVDIFNVPLTTEYYVPEIESSKEFNTFKDYLGNESCSDITLKSLEHKEFKAHRIILASRSPVFKSQLKQNPDNTILETPLESEVLEELLSYIYTNTTTKIEAMPEKLLIAAHQYGIRRLKNLCERSLHTKITLDNAIDMLQLSENNAAYTLQFVVMEFIKTGNIEYITKSDAWDRLTSVKLIKKLTYYCSTKYPNCKSPFLEP